MTRNISRRHFVKQSSILSAATAVGLSAAQAEKVSGANERVRLGVIGIANRGMQVTQAFLSHPDVELTAICDVDAPQMDRASKQLNQKVDKYVDFRKLLDRDDIDAVLIATPDHWHAIQTILACRSGKDVYVEKPMSATIHEGRRMVDVARETKCVVQVGTHRRSSKVWNKAIEMIRTGVLGKITLSQAYRVNNMFPNGIGKQKPSAPPKGLDWDLWVGPRADQPYQGNITPYKFRWWKNYSSQMGNWGIHYLDVIRWALEEVAPSAICMMGGNYAIEDDRTIPDTAQAIFEFPSGSLAMFGTYEAFGNPMLPKGELEVRGTNGSMTLSYNGYDITREKRGQFQTKAPEGKDLSVPMETSNEQDTQDHTRNFLDCIKTRAKPNADVEIGHRSTSMVLLANLSLESKSRLEWDAKAEKITNLPDLNQHLHYEYRSPWSLD